LGDWGYWSQPGACWLEPQWWGYLAPRPHLRPRLTANNRATAGSGGGIFNLLDDATLTDTTVNGNTATFEAGGIDNNAGTTTLNDSTVTSNTARVGESGSYGGGIYDFSGTVSLNDSNVRRNAPDNCAPAGSVGGCIG